MPPTPRTRKGPQSDTVRLGSGLHKLVEDFLKTPYAKELALDSKTDVANEALRQFLRKYGLIK